MREDTNLRSDLLITQSLPTLVAGRRPDSHIACTRRTETPSALAVSEVLSIEDSPGIVGYPEVGVCIIHDGIEASRMPVFFIIFGQDFESGTEFSRLDDLWPVFAICVFTGRVHDNLLSGVMRASTRRGVTPSAFPIPPTA